MDRALVSPAVAAQASLLVDEGRVWLVNDAKAIVAGRNAWYTVIATKQGVACNCENPLHYCSHACAAMIAWAERKEGTRNGTG